MSKFMNNLDHRVIMVLISLFMTCAVFGVSASWVYADRIDEIEPNDTQETAQLIPENSSTALGATNGSAEGQNLIIGYASTSDEDWFKVYLTVGRKYLTCQEETYNYYVTDSNGNELLSGKYVKGSGLTAYSFEVEQEGYYYVRITGDDKYSSRYKFTVGGPMYTVASCEISCKEGVINMTSAEKTKIAHFDGIELNGLPENAIAYSIKMNGLRSSTVKSIRLINSYNGLNFALTPYTWKADNLVSMKLPVASVWTAQFEYNGVNSFTPTLTVYYVYPIYYQKVK